MKQKFITLTLLILACLSARAYEVYEHNQGDESHLVKKSKVMNARYATIWDQWGEPPGLYCIWFDNDLGILEFYDREERFSGYFHPKVGDFAVITPTSIRIESGSKDTEVDFILKINYNLVDGKKVYTIQFHDNNKNINATVNGRPTFFKDRFGDDPLIGSETTMGRTPVLLEWLEYQLKKNKFKIIYE